MMVYFEEKDSFSSKIDSFSRKCFYWNMVKNEILLSSLFIMLLLIACAPGKFSIEGKVKGYPDGEVLVLQWINDKWDTLSRGKLENGIFHLEGRVDSLILAQLSFGQAGSEKFLLEEGKFKVKGKRSRLVIGGKAAQGVFARFENNMTCLWEEMGRLENRFYEFQKSGDSLGMERVVKDIERLIDGHHVRENALIRENPNSVASAYAVYSALNLLNVPAFMRMSLIHPITYEQLREKYLTLGEDGKKSYYGKIVGDYVEKQERVAVGAIAPDFTLESPTGEKISLHGIKGKVKLIDFWASWCGPCRGENPNVLRIYKRFHDKGLEIIGVSLDDNKEKWEEAIQEDGLVWVHVSDLKGWQSSTVVLYQINSVPSTFLLDGDNRIVAKNLRGEELEMAIEKLLK